MPTPIAKVTFDRSWRCDPFVPPAAGRLSDVAHLTEIDRAVPRSSLGGRAQLSVGGVGGAPGEVFELVGERTQGGLPVLEVGD